MFSCSESRNKFKSDIDFQSYLNNSRNGFIQSEESADFIFEVKLIPALKNENEEQFTVQLRIKRKDEKSVLDSDDVTQMEKSSREGYLSFELLENISVEFDGKSEPAIFHHYERNYGIKPSIDVLFNFKNIHPKHDVYFVYRDQVFNQGLIKIKFKKELFTTCYVEE